MRIISVGAILAASLVAGSPGVAKGQPDNPQRQSVGELHRALAAVAATAQQPGQFNPKADGDQGDDHANPRAILRVCSKDTPAAQRAAICPVGVSPE
ncbi:MAG: hypothetical protein M3Q19_14345 [Pseudomonadota bacterium]|nr:hypothetical protein [Pseudomonadota bacterium]